jgi:hypothetical protein
VAAALALSLGAGCSDDDAMAPEPAASGTRVTGFVLRADNAQPVADASVWLVAEDGLTLVAGPARTNASGAYAFTGISPGTYRLAVNTIAGICLAPFAGHDALFAVAEGDSLEERDDLLMRSILFGCTRPPAILMQVFDESSGAPVAGARIAQSVLDAPFDASTEMFTDERGEALFDARTETIPLSDPPRRTLAEMIVHHPAYSARVFPGVDSLIVVPEGNPPVVRIGLRARSRASAAIVRGRVVSGDAATLGEPLGGVRVALAIATPPVVSAKNAAGDTAALNMLIATTDSAGLFEFREIEPGDYSVRPAYLPTDRLVSIAGIDEGPYRVASDSAQITTPNLSVASALPVFAPEPDAAAPSDTVVFRWARVPNATSYELLMRGSFPGSLMNIATTADTSIALRFFPGGEPLRWQVLAIDSELRVLTRSEPPRIVTPARAMMSGRVAPAGETFGVRGVARADEMFAVQRVAR